ncbi:AAA-like domain-containing protein [bacterium]|nr:AAA-like domain-containing protein [bacterium]MDA7679845.1 AAA-like domain-containing protein [bacterium]MDC0276898.1 AAA-like domain-containing protein [bacterium]
MTDIKPDFFVTGGTLRRDALSYIVRDADEKVYDGLLKGEFCYVLTPRQMGKSSLMVRTAVRLRDAGVTVAVLDLTGIGSNLTAEQWYEGLLNNIGTQLDLEDELDDYWDNNEGRSPLQRWLGAIRKIVLPTVGEQLVVFVDEIDMVRSLPFSTDEFFASIREFHNSRSINADSEKITFCLLGVAAPADLISNPLITPFNIGRRIELKDFTDAQSEQLAEGVNKGDRSLEIVGRVLHWTGGHPYLTQKMCQSISSKDEIRTVNQVDDLCHKMFLSSQARDKDINLSFVRDRMLKSDDDIATLLDIYSRVNKDLHVPANEKNPVFDTLILSGIVRIEDGEFRISNRIYKHVFDKAWVVEHMPGAELRRQRREFWRGVIRAAAVAVFVIAIIGTLAGYAVIQKNEAELANERSRKNLYMAEINLARNAMESSNYSWALELLNNQIPAEGQVDLRGWEWRYLMQDCEPDYLRKYGEHRGLIRALKFAPNGNMFATSSFFGSEVIIWDFKDKKEVVKLNFNTSIRSIDFSNDGKLFACGGGNFVKLYNTENFQEISTLSDNNDVCAVVFSEDSRYLGVTGQQIYVLDLLAKKKIWEESAFFNSGRQYGHVAAFSKNGKYFASKNRNNRFSVWETQNFKKISEIDGNLVAINFAPNNDILVAGTWEGELIYINTKTWELIERIESSQAWISGVSFSPKKNDLRFATTSGDQTVKIWDLETRENLQTFKGHKHEVWCVDYSPDGEYLVTGAKDDEILIWENKLKSDETNELNIPGNPNTWASQISSDRIGVLLPFEDKFEVYNLEDFSLEQDVTASINYSMPENIQSYTFVMKPAILAAAYAVNKVRIISPNQEVRDFKVGTSKIINLQFSRNAKLLVVANDAGVINVFEIETGKIRHKLNTGKSVRRVTISNDGSILFCNKSDRTYSSWDLSTGKKINNYPSLRQGSRGLIITPDNKIVSTVTLDGVGKLWDLHTGETLSDIKGSLLAFHSLDIMPDGKRLLAATGEGDIIVWDVPTGKELTRIQVGEGGVQKIVALPDNNTVVSIGFGGRIIKWQAKAFN